MKRAYCRCTSGHYFMGEHCPFDGWSSSASKELTKAVEKLHESGQEICLETLRKAGVSASSLRRIIVVEFGTSSAAFEAIVPEELVVNGEAKSPMNLGANFN